MSTKYNYDKTITYYLGAGASANAIPMVSGINESLKDLCWFVRENIARSNFPKAIGTSHYTEESFDKFYSFLEKWKGQVEPTPSIDTFAKRLFDNGKRKEYSEYKIFLTIAFHYFHFARKISNDFWGMNILDGRYENLFRSINSIQNYSGFNTIIPHCFNFITWNYDFQLEYSRVLDYCNEEELQDAKINSFYRSMENRFEKLNGSALLDQLHHIDYKSKMGITNTADLFNLLFIIYNELINNKKDISSLRFSWENKVNLTNLSNIAKDTDILVIIGYSFPSFNRMVDKAFYSNLKSDCIIYTQGRDLQDSIRIKGYFEQCFPPHRKPENVIPVESPFFFVPPQYFEPEFEERRHYGIAAR